MLQVLAEQASATAPTASLQAADIADCTEPHQLAKDTVPTPTGTRIVPTLTFPWRDSMWQQVLECDRPRLVIIGWFDVLDPFIVRYEVVTAQVAGGSS